MKESQKELLKPTILNLFGLDIRFRYTEQQLQAEREKKRMTSARKDNSTQNKMNFENRHAVPEALKEIISPRKVIPMTRRDSYLIFKMQLKKEERIKQSRTTNISPANKKKIELPQSEQINPQEQLKNNELLAQDAEYWINNYRQSVAFYSEKLQDNLVFNPNNSAKQKDEMDLSSKILENEDTLIKQHIGSTQIHANIIRTSSLKYQMPPPIDYSERGRLYLRELRQQMHQREQKKLDQGTENQTKKTTILDIMTMTPAEKQKYLEEHQRKEKEKVHQHRKDENYEMRQIINHDVTEVPCGIHKRQQQSQSMPNSPVRITSLQKNKNLIKNKHDAQAQSNSRGNFQDKFLGLAKESQHFKNILQQTFHDSNKLEKQYKEERMKEKVKIMGSLYGVPSTQYSDEREIEELISKMPAMITKPLNFMREGDIDYKYNIFQRKVQEYKKDEKARKEEEELNEQLYGIGSGPKDDDYDLRDYQVKKSTLNRSLFDKQHEDCTKISSIIFRQHANNGISIGRPKKQLDTSLDLKEKEILRKKIQDEIQGYQDFVQKKYHDNYNSSSMIDPENTKMTNEIMRQFKFQQMKQRNLPNFIRKKREELIQLRQSLIWTSNGKNQTSDFQYNQALDKQLTKDQQTLILKQISNSDSNRAAVGIDNIQNYNSSFQKKKLSQAIIHHQNTNDQGDQLKDEFVDYMKEILTKTTGSNILGAKQIKTQNLTEDQETNQMISLLQKGVDNKINAVVSLRVPEIITSQIRKDILLSIK